MFDTHVNLHAEAYDEDLDEVLTRAREAGVSRMLAICERLDSFPRVKAIADDQSRYLVQRRNASPSRQRFCRHGARRLDRPRSRPKGGRDW